MSDKLEDILRLLPVNASILDYGCFGFDLYKRASYVRDDLKHYAADFDAPEHCPENIEFGMFDLGTSRTQFRDDYFDCVVASHVIEHSQNPTELFAELVRICKPGGQIYIEAPSDKSVKVNSDPHYKNNNFYSFWDDPTHVRPWTPAAFYRLALSFGCELDESCYIGGHIDKLLWPFIKILTILKCIRCDTSPYIWRANQWACYGVFTKPKGISGHPDYKYISLKP